MNRIALRALALGCAAALPLSACNTTGSTPAAIEAILDNPANVTPAQIAAALAAADPSLAAKINAVAAQANTYVQAACGIVPIASSLASIAAAFYGASGVVVPATELAAAFCKPYQTAAAPKMAATRSMRVAAPLQAGAQVSRDVTIGGVTVRAAGTVIDPSKVK